MNLSTSPASTWQTPPEPIHQILNTPANPTVWLLEAESQELCSISELQDTIVVQTFPNLERKLRDLESVMR